MASKINVDKIARGSGTPEFTIPTADGAADTFLKTDGSGVLSFGAVTTTALTGSTNTWIPTITAANALTGTANFTYDGNILDVKNSGTASTLKLYCESSNAHYQAIKAAPHAGSSDWTLTLPSTVPSVSGQALVATTAGVASWATAGTVNTPAFGVTLSTGQSIATNTWTKLTFNSEVFDSDGNFDSSTNHRFTPTTAGTYYVIAQSGYDLSQATIAATGIYKNGSEAAMKQGRHAGTVIWIGSLNGSSDYIEGFTYQNQGSTQTAYSSVGNGHRTWMFGMRIA